MPVIIPDELLQQAGLSEREARIEIACRLYDAELIAQPDAVRLARISRADFWEALQARGLPWMHLDESDLERELAVIPQTGGQR